ncbi:hypothetical protein IT157_07840 [bacterium]|nr:hypothetical protein [bacterium]
MLAASLRRGIIFSLLLTLGSAYAGDEALSDYEWQLNTPGRTLFRDRTPVGQVPLSADGGKGLFAKKGKTSGEQLQVLSDIAFQPGDTMRYFALGLRLIDGDQLIAESFADADEVPGLLSAARYVVSTATNIADTERSETEIYFQSRAGFKLQFVQVGKAQAYVCSFHAGNAERTVSRALTGDQVSIFADLIDLALFELNRQGAGIKIPKSN